MSLRTIDLVGPTRLVFLAMGEDLNFGFNYVVLHPSDRRGTNTYCIVVIKDNKMGFSSYCLSLSRYIMSSYLMREGRGNNEVVIYISLYHDKCLLFTLELYREE